MRMGGGVCLHLPCEVILRPDLLDHEALNDVARMHLRRPTTDEVMRTRRTAQPKAIAREAFLSGATPSDED